MLVSHLSGACGAAWYRVLSCLVNSVLPCLAQCCCVCVVVGIPLACLVLSVFLSRVLCVFLSRVPCVFLSRVPCVFLSRVPFVSLSHVSCVYCGRNCLMLPRVAVLPRLAQCQVSSPIFIPERVREAEAALALGQRTQRHLLVFTGVHWCSLVLVEHVSREPAHTPVSREPAHTPKRGSARHTPPSRAGMVARGLSECLV